MAEFNATQVKDELVQWIRDWFYKNGPDSPAVIGISGGKDSSVAAALCAEALGTDRVVGILMPNGTQADIADSHRIVETLGIKSVVVNIADAVNGLKDSAASAGVCATNQATVNLAPRIRMTTLYYISQSMNGRVINTCNLSENVCGFSTLYGDHAGDVSLFDQLTVTEIRKIGALTKLPAELVNKTPSDGLTGKSDEEAYGFSYDILDNYIRTGECADPEIKEKILSRYRAGKFKLDLINFPHFDSGLEVKI